jgi:hypothetical protein
MLNIYFPQLANIHIVVQIRGGMVFFITGGWGQYTVLCVRPRSGNTASHCGCLHCILHKKKLHFHCWSIKISIKIMQFSLTAAIKRFNSVF